MDATTTVLVYSSVAAGCGATVPRYSTVEYYMTWHSTVQYCTL